MRRDRIYGTISLGVAQSERWYNKGQNKVRRGRRNSSDRMAYRASSRAWHTFSRRARCLAMAQADRPRDPCRAMSIAASTGNSTSFPVALQNSPRRFYRGNRKCARGLGVLQHRTAVLSFSFLSWWDPRSHCGAAPRTSRDALCRSVDEDYSASPAARGRAAAKLCQLDPFRESLENIHELTTLLIRSIFCFYYLQV